MDRRKKSNVEKILEMYRRDLRASPTYEGDPDKLTEKELYLAWLRNT